jgi:hypothetical protein
MARRTTVQSALVAVIFISSAVAMPGQALAKKKAAVRAAQAAVPGPVVVPDSNIPADRVPRCFDSVIRYPSPPCY